MDRVGEQLLREKKAAVASGQDETSKTSRDLLSLLVRANMASDTAHRMSDKDVLAREHLARLPNALSTHD
jgi:hypothetical protein